MKSMLYAALLTAAFPITALAQSADEIKNAEQTPRNVGEAENGRDGLAFPDVAK